MNFEQLKKRHREIRDHSPANLRLRVHRALSWLQRAEMAEDEDGRFIYEIRLLQRDGRLAKLKVDAVNGRVLGIKRKGP